MVMLCTIISSLAFAEKLQAVGVLEFEEKTTIGQENATVIVPEILMTYLNSIGSYKLAERILLKTVVESLAFQLSGYSESGYRRAVLERELAKNRFGALLGTVSWGNDFEPGYTVPFEFKIQNFVRLTAEYFFYKDLSLHTAINGSYNISIDYGQ